MSVASTPARMGSEYLGEVTYATTGASTAEIVDSSAATTTWSKLASRMGQAVLPITAAAAIASLRTPIYRRVFSVGFGSGSQVRPVLWSVGDFVYTEAQITLREIEALNRLLNLDLAEGFTLDLPDV